MHDSLFSSLAQALVLVFAVGPLIAWLKTRAEREPKTKSLNRFTLKTPRTYTSVFLGVTLAFEALMIFSYAYNGLSFGDWDASLLWLGHALAFVMMIILFIAVMQRLEVDGDELRYRTIFGRTRRTTFANVDTVSTTNQKLLVSVYASGKRFASFSGDVLCLDNFFKRCAKEDIPVLAREKKPTTLWSLYRSAISVLIGLSAGISAAIALIVIVLVVSGSAPPRTLVSIIPLCLVITALIVGGCSVVPLRGITQIKRQERLGGFSFDREMADRNARGSSFSDDAWFVAVTNCNIIAFRRDYLGEVSAARNTESGNECRAVSLDDKSHKVRGANPVLKEFRTWFNSGV